MKRKINKRSMALLVSLAVVLTVAVGVTLAYIFTKTDPVENTFKPSKVTCAVIEDGKTTDDPFGQVNVSSKSNVQIKNTGDTTAYIRVAVVVTWKNEKGNVWAQAPVEGTDYTIDWAYDDKDNPTRWTSDDDGYYYYNDPVAPGDLTGILITEAKLKEGYAAPVGTDGTQYYLSIEIVASAIQAEGMGAENAQDAWAKAKTKTQGST